MNHLSNQIQTALEQAAAPSVLTWKSKKVKGALITKIGGKRYLGIVRKDSKGQEYWKYHLLTKFSEPTVVSSPAPKPESKEIEHSQEVEESEQIKKFREKYGIPNQSQKST